MMDRVDGWGNLYKWESFYYWGEMAEELDRPDKHNVQKALTLVNAL